MHEPLWQSAMVVAQASDPAAAQQFLSIAFSAEGQATLTKYGFDLP
jgi:ABC-type molybdate transport system substrate-binding protein